MKISLDFQPRPMVADHSRNGSCSEGVLDLDGNGQADLVCLGGPERLTEPVVDLLALQQLSLKTGKKLFTESELKEADLGPKVVQREESPCGAVENCYEDVCLASTEGGQAMLKAAEAERAELPIVENGYQIAGPMEFVIDPFNMAVFVSQSVSKP